MATYSFTQYTSSVILQYFYSYPYDYHFVFWDVCLNISFVFLLGNIGTATELTKQRPPSTLFSFANILQLFVFYLLQLAVQLLAIMAIRGPFADNIDYYAIGGEEVNSRRYRAEGASDFLFDSPECNVIFLVSNFSYLGGIIAFTVTKPWRQEIYSYWPFVLCFIAFFVYSICLVMVPGSRIFLFKLIHVDDQQLNNFLLAIGVTLTFLIIFL